MAYSIPSLIMLFFVYGFLGWCVEVAFAACREGRFVNRGFLNGPICPIYGFGVVGVVLLLEPFSENLAVLFAGSVVVTTVIEFLTGFILEKVFHARWWDYSEMKFNVMGYVCLLFSLMWGAACVVVIRLVHPLIYGVVRLLPNTLMAVLVCVLCAVIAVDIAATLATIRKLNQRLKKLTELAAEIHGFSDGIGQAISDSTLSAKRKAAIGEEKFSEGVRRLNEMRVETGERIDQSKRAMAEKIEQSREAVAERFGQGVDAGRRSMSALRERFAHALEEKPFGQRRLLSAFPHLKSHSYQEALAALRESDARRRRKRKNTDAPQ